VIVVRVTIVVNGSPAELDVAPDTRLLDVLRDRLGLTGTKEACGRGECGACTVLIDGRPRLSCVELAARAGHVETVEGLAEESARFREAMARTGGFQCGFCTPGQVVRAVSLLRGGLPRGDAELREAINGNLCRCTGYDAIVAAYRLADRGEAQ
jgi:aerobic-type carbon monoxide dehydrogenase small subunit (CoxS/CutS family)